MAVTRLLLVSVPAIHNVLHPFKAWGKEDFIESTFYVHVYWAILNDEKFYFGYIFKSAVKGKGIRMDFWIVGGL